MITKQSIDNMIEMMREHNITPPYQMQCPLEHVDDLIAVMGDDFESYNTFDYTVNHMLRIQRGASVIGIYKHSLYLVAIAIIYKQC